MVSAINFAVRDGAGAVNNGVVAGEGQSNVIRVGSGDSVSLNISRASVVGYEQQGSDLIVKLTDGRSIKLAGYFDVAPGDVNHLYLSHDDMIAEVFVKDSGNGMLFADYGAAQGYEKWSPLDNLKFAESDPLAAVVVASNEPAGMGMLIPGLLGLGGLGTGAAAAAAVVGGAAVIGAVAGGGGSNGGGSDGSDGSGGNGRPAPTVNPADTTTVTTNTDNPTLDVSGTGVAGDTVVVTIGDKSETTTVGEDGNWSVSFPETNLPADGEYEAGVVVTTPDGDVTLSGPDFVIDLTPPDVAVTSGAKSSGHVENAADYADGVDISGTGEPGATIAVTIAGSTQTTTVTESGSWTVTFPTSQVEGGEYETGITVTATDQHGNRTVITDTLVVDTVANTVSFDAVTQDNTVNLSESQGTLVLTGTATPGAVLTFTLAGVSQTVTAGSDGSWTTSWAAGTVATGDYASQITVTSTDAAGNSTTESHAFNVDTSISVALPSGQVGGDDTMNAAERAAGISLTGTAEAGATVVVALASGASVTTTADSAGVWSAAFATAQLPQGETTTAVTVTATDAAGNSATATGTLAVDTVAPDAPDISEIVRNSGAMTGIIADIDGDTVTFHQVNAAGDSSSLSTTQIDMGSADFYRFSSGVPDGSYLVIENADAAGNSASTLVVVNNTTTATVDLGRDGLSDFDFTKIDLTLAPQASLSITEAQLNAITGPDKTLTISGDSDDSVSLVGGKATGTSTEIGGETFHVYTLGSGGTVLVDDDIQTTVI